jgi:hypothetical protein
MRRLARRGTRKVPTHSPCMDITCGGEYVATAEPEKEWDLRCSSCGEMVPKETWRKWGALSEWVSPERAAGMLGISVQAVWQRAKRGQWRRDGEGKSVRYLTADVMSERMSA